MPNTDTDNNPNRCAPVAGLSADPADYEVVRWWADGIRFASLNEAVSDTCDVLGAAATLMGPATADATSRAAGQLRSAVESLDAELLQMLVRLDARLVGLRRRVSELERELDEQIAEARYDRERLARDGVTVVENMRRRYGRANQSPPKNVEAAAGRLEATLMALAMTQSACP